MSLWRLVFLLAWTVDAWAQSSTAIVIAPVVDVWSAPAADTSTLTADMRETQLLFEEKVVIHESSGAWVRIEAPAQPEFTHHHRWEGYPGWILRDVLWRPSDADSFRGALVGAARAMMKTEYLWGGLSAGQGLDCSGLVHLAYRLNGLKVPRDAQEQWMRSLKIQPRQLRPGDLVFSAKSDRPETVTHVALYAGDGELIEAPQTGLTVRTISFQDKFGVSLAAVKSGQIVGDRVVYFGRLVQD